jgi:hypothetical protein
MLLLQLRVLLRVLQVPDCKQDGLQGAAQHTTSLLAMFIQPLQVRYPAASQQLNILKACRCNAIIRDHYQLTLPPLSGNLVPTSAFLTPTPTLTCPTHKCQFF